MGYPSRPVARIGTNIIHSDKFLTYLSIYLF